jgi:alpha-glucosidase (family GH31 glycosyl hydrolase)
MKSLHVLIFLIFTSGIFSGVNAQYALEFNGDSDYVALNGQDFAPPWTMEVMVNKSETDNYQHLLTGIDGNSGIRIEQWWGTKIGFTLSGVADYTFNYALPLQQWVHVALVNNGSSTTLYADGVNKGTISASINMPLKWISKNTDDAAMKAKIDELRIWGTDLSQTVIQEYMGQGVDPSHPNYDELKHYYKFDEGSGNTCYDSKGNLNGTIFGAVYYIETDWDAMVSKLVNPENTTDNFSSNELITIEVKNNGLNPIDVDFEVGYIMDGGDPVINTINASSNPIASGQTLNIDFPPIDLNTSGSYHFKFYTALPGDENPSNDTLDLTLVSVSNMVGNVTNFESDENEYIFTCDQDKVKVIFYKPDMFRIWLGVNGNFPNPAGNLIVESLEFPPINSSWSDEGDHYLLESDSAALRAYKQPLRFELYKKDNETLIWKETTGLDYGVRTFQELDRQEDEYFYGGGMQNGYFSHRGKVIKISKEISNWDDGAVPNPVPFYMSTNGYGAMRHTFAPGEYDFRQAVLTSHQEQRFDCFYFVGDNLKQILNLYTELTGRPALPPRWGLELGDADCYNDNGQTTPVVIEEIADKYREYDLPGGWILPNDGYGCGYTDLPYVVEELHERGFYTGLWTENGVSQIQWEVGTAGTRACKLDVAWVGSGYQWALNACKQAYQGIENNCDERGFVWSVCGWAGTQRYSVVWSGDQSGNWEYIRFHIPTIIGAGLSGFNLASSDLDGIFGGSAQTYTRDLQWKTFIPTTYAMSGWAANNKQPWVYGQTFTDINREYLKLKMRLTPYMYTYCNEAYETGVPAVRAMVLEYPEDPVCWGTDTRYQFMSGENFLVAPVYKYSTNRDSIYFPGGVWYDYWNGDVYTGPMWINDYPIDLEKIPVFVKAGAIIPMYPEMLHDREKPKDPITFDIYPDGHSSFVLYEDDGVSKEHREGAFAKTLIECYGGGDPTSYVDITVGASIGEYDGKLDFRSNRFEVHFVLPPEIVMLDEETLPQYNSIEELENAIEGWFWDPDDHGGIVFIKTQPLPTDSGFNIVIDTPIGTEDTRVNEQVKVYPNPGSELIYVEFPADKSTTIDIYNTEGKLLTSFSSNTNGSKLATFDLSSEPEGVYIFKIKSGNQIIGKKVTLVR